MIPCFCTGLAGEIFTPCPLHDPGEIAARAAIDWPSYTEVPDPYARKLPPGCPNDGSEIDCVFEGRREWLNCDPIMAFIGHAVITHWRLARNKRGSET